MSSAVPALSTGLGIVAPAGFEISHVELDFEASQVRVEHVLVEADLLRVGFEMLCQQGRHLIQSQSRIFQLLVSNCLP